jgi:hypothetical protein
MRTAILAAVVMVTLLVAPASAMPAETVAKAARETHCTHQSPNYLIGPKNTGITCRARGHGEFYILRYKSKTKALRFWRNWLSAGQAIGYRGSLFLIPAEGDEWYRPADARWAAKRTHGRVLVGR